MKNRFATAALSCCLVAIAVSASEGEVNYRQHTMSAIGGHMRAIVDIIRGDVPHTSHLATHAGAMADLAEIAPTLFPKVRAAAMRSTRSGRTRRTSRASSTPSRKPRRR